MKTAKYELFYKDKMTFEEYQLRAKRIAKTVSLNAMMNRMDERDYKNIMIELLQYNNIFDIIHAYSQVLENDPKSYTSIAGIIAEELQPTSEESFCRWGDRNHLTSQLKKNYFSKNDYWTLDVQATRMSEDYAKEITENDLVEFICTYPKGKNTYKNEIQLQKEDLMQQFEALTNFSLTEKFVKKYLADLTSINQVSSEECPF